MCKQICLQAFVKVYKFAYLTHTLYYIGISVVLDQSWFQRPFLGRIIQLHFQRKLCPDLTKWALFPTKKSLPLIPPNFQCLIFLQKCCFYDYKSTKDGWSCQRNLCCNVFLKCWWHQFLKGVHDLEIKNFVRIERKCLHLFSNILLNQYKENKWIKV